MYWHRPERSPGRFSLVGTTVRAAERLPRHLVAGERPTTLVEGKAREVDLAATAGGGCCLGMGLAETAGADDLTAAYGVFRAEARCPGPGCRPETVNTDGRPATRAAWRALFKGVALILRSLHAFLKARDRAVHMEETFDGLRGRTWEAYHAPGARSFSPRLRRLREWAKEHVGKEVVWEKVLALCDERRAFARAYHHPGCYRTGNLVGRLLRRLDYHLYCTQHRHGTARRWPPSRGYGAGR